MMEKPSIFHDSLQFFASNSHTFFFAGDNITDLVSSPMEGSLIQEQELGVTDRTPGDDLTPVASELVQTTFAEASSSDLSPSQGESGKSMGSSFATAEITTSTTHSTPTTPWSTLKTATTTIRPCKHPLTLTAAPMFQNYILIGDPKNNLCLFFF